MNEIIDVSVVRADSALAVGSDRRPPSALIPLPEVPIKVRLATNDDIPFIDGLQKKNNKSLGFMPQMALEGKIKRDEILIAEEGSIKVGYLIGNDRYQKRDELGCIFQLCVVPDKRRGLRGATLLKALFERASYGCKLYCCWCAQDLEANYFWESMGFVPVAFRTGSRNKNKRQDGQKGARIHIFWQKRIRAGDRETPYWYPHETGGGSIGEDRIVLPIDPRIHWSQVKLEVLPGEEATSDERLAITDQSKSNSETRTPSVDPQSTTDTPQSKPKPKRAKNIIAPVPVVKHSGSLLGGWSRRVQPVVKVEQAKVKREKPKREKPANTQKVKQKNDPEKVKAARYVRDRYMEEINRGDYLVSNGKYDVTRLIENVVVPIQQITGGTCEDSPHRPVPPKLLDVVPVEVKLAA